jgi:hypothetical protein
MLLVDLGKCQIERLLAICRHWDSSFCLVRVDGAGTRWFLFAG